MEKTTHPYYNPQEPQQMSAAPPPSYEQATNIVPKETTSATSTATYPQVQVLPAPTLNPPPAQRITTTTTTTGYGGGFIGGPGVQPSSTQHVFIGAQQGVPPQSVVIIQQPTVLPLGPEPAYITCPGCHIQKLTRIEYEPNSRTHLMALILCVLGLWCCVCLPYCAGSCMSANHYCRNCNKFLGTYSNSI